MALGCPGVPGAAFCQPPEDETLSQNMAVLVYPKSTAIPNPPALGPCSWVSTPCLPSPPNLQMNHRTVPWLFWSLVPHHRLHSLSQGPGEAELSLTDSAEIPTPFLWEQSHSSPSTPCKPQSWAGGCRGVRQGHEAGPAGNPSAAQG